MSENIENSIQDKLLHMVSESICMPCEDERKKSRAINYDNPLNCPCRCEPVSEILEQAKRLSKKQII